MTGPYSTSSSSFALYPLNIQSDPRVYRGSVYAFLRQQEKAYLRFELENRKEKHYQLGVMRTRLATSLPPISNKPRTSPSTTTHIIRPPSYHLQPKRQSVLPPIKPVNSSIDKNFNRVQFIPRTYVKKSNNYSPIRVEPSLSPSRHLVSSSRSSIHRPRIAYAITPPSTQHRPRFTHVHVQTSDVLDESIEKIVAELADSAITLSITNLQLEDETTRLRSEIMEKDAILETNRIVLKTALQEAEVATKHKEETEMTLQERHYRQQQSRTEALTLCRELTKHSISRARRLEDEHLVKRSIAIDTRQLNSRQYKLDEISKELEKDFLPWLIYRAEKTFKRGTGIGSAIDRKKKRRVFRDV